MKWALGLLALFGMAVGMASAQTSPAEALRGTAKKVMITDLPESFRAVTLGASEFGGLGLYGIMGMSMGSANQDQALDLLSLVGVVFVDPDEFAAMLDGKRPRVRGYVLDLTQMMRDNPRNPEVSSTPTPVFMETWIEGGRIIQWSARPGIYRETLLKSFSKPTTPNLAVLKAETLSNVKQVALGITLYANDYDDQFPNAGSTAKAQDIVSPYTKNLQVWSSKNPEGGRLLYNTSLSRVISTSIERPYETPVVWDEKPWPDGGRAVGFADGHAKYVTAAEWDQSIWLFELQRRNRTAPNKIRAVPAPPWSAGLGKKKAPVKNRKP
jgi:hypothetical protein